MAQDNQADSGSGSKWQNKAAESQEDIAPNNHPTPEVIAQALEKVVAVKHPSTYEAMNEGQHAYLKNWLFSISSYMSELTEERRRVNGEIPAREGPKASSYIYTGEAEKEFYSGVLNGSISPEKARGMIEPQDIVYTAHPNFSSTRELAQVTPDIMKDFVLLSTDDLLKMSQGVDQAAAVLSKHFDNSELGSHMKKAVDAITPRKPRSRSDELDEATIDLIPGIYDSITEEAMIMLKRARMVSADIPEKLSFEQVQALSELTSNHSTWYTDGDGKRTSHAWDNEFAIPGIKAASLKSYIADLKELREQVSSVEELDSDMSRVISTLEKRLGLIEEVRDAARERMLALTALQSDADKHGVHDRETITEKRVQLRQSVKEAGVRYERLISSDEDGGKTDHLLALTSDSSKDVLELMKKLKSHEANGVDGTGLIRFEPIKSRFDIVKDGKSSLATPINAVDALILKASKGDFPVKLERRENANMHKVSFRVYLNRLASSGAFEKLVGMPIPGTNETLTEDEIYSAKAATVTADEKNLLKVLKVIDDVAARSRNGEKLSGKEQKLVKQLSTVLDQTYRSIAKDINPKYGKMPTRNPIEQMEQDSYFLNDVAPFHLSGKLYKDAFKRLIIAEAGSPPNTMLSRGDSNEIRDEAILRSNNDILTVNIFKNLMDSNVDVVPLYEDPDAILNTPKMIAQQLADPAFHNALGIDKKHAADHAMQDQHGEITAYEFMRRNGYTDTIMTQKKMDIDALKEAHVYVGPHKMLANSDSAKRGSLAASILNQVSLVESYEAASHHLITGDNGKKYLFINKTYLGQGGSLARTSGSDALISTVTEQGQHASATSGIYSAMKSVTRGVTRLMSKVRETERAEDHVDDMTQTPAGRKYIALESMALGNPYGMRMDAQFIGEIKQNALQAVRKRIASTRDDIKLPGSGKIDPDTGKEVEKLSRYESLLKKYGEDLIPNYSARPASKSKKVDFVGIRAIGLAGKEFGFFSNIVGVSEMFSMNHEGRLLNLDVMAKIYQNDPSVKHNFDAASYTASLSHKTLEHVWSKGGVTISKDSEGDTWLEKQGDKVRLDDVVGAYNDKKIQFRKFDAADLALANIHKQTENFVSGMSQIKQTIALGPGKNGVYPPVPVKRVDDAIVLIPEHLRSTVEHGRKLAGDLVAYMRKMEAKPGVFEEVKEHARHPENLSADGMSLRMAKDSYHQLMETSLEQQALSRVKLMGQGRAA